MKKKMIIEALLHTLLPIYGNEYVYHPDGSAIPVADLIARFCPPDSLNTSPIKITSSHGFYLVDRMTGDVVYQMLDRNAPASYRFTYWFDLDEYFRWRPSQYRNNCTDIDICGITYHYGKRDNQWCVEPFVQGWREDIEELKSETETFGNL
jgi:hypothetical protein